MLTDRMRAHLAASDEVLETVQGWLPPSLRLVGTERVSIFDCHPWFFRDAFPSVPDDAVDELAIAVRLLVRPLIHADGRTGPDGPGAAGLPADVRHALLGLYQTEANRYLSRLFPAPSPFWPRFVDLLRGRAEALRHRQDFTDGNLPWNGYDEKEAAELSRSLNVLSRVSVLALAELDGGSGAAAVLEGVLDGFAFAYELLRGVDSWWDDTARGVPSCFLAGLLTQPPPRSDATGMAGLRAQLEADLADGTHQRSRLLAAADALRRADDALVGLPDVAFRAVIGSLLRACVERLERGLDVIVALDARDGPASGPALLTLPPGPASTAAALAWKGLRALVRAADDGFADDVHVMLFPKWQGFVGEPEEQHGDVFLRALVADTLLDAEETLGVGLRPLVEREVEYLLGRRLRTGVGGWSYFPDLPELPPDADDLAQVVQVLTRAGRDGEVRHHAARPLAVLLGESGRADGGFETWIIPRQRGDQEQLHQRWVDMAWGAGPDDEVIANLLYALWCHDRDRYVEEIAAGTTFLAGRQQPDGTWASTWYHGPWYGTWVCLRLLRCTRSHRAAALRALAAVRTGQGADGGWALHDGAGSDPLSTALALLALSEGPPGDGDRGSAGAGIRFLEQAVAGPSGWEAVPFIRMDLGRPTGTPWLTLTYASRAASTSMAVKACLAWARRDQEGGRR
jgi:squalene-hopene/tetraprenyl-beta-curcumene cyclase